MQMKALFLFLLFVDLVLPLATAFNCTQLDGEEYDMCQYIENTNWPQSEKDAVIQDLINSGGISLDGDYESILDRPIEDIQLNSIEESQFEISDEDKTFLIDFSSVSLFGYMIYSFLKKSHLLSKLI